MASNPQAPPPELTPAEKLDRRIWARVNHDYERALALAVKFWPLTVNGAPQHPPETVHAVAASLLNHFRDLKRIATAPRPGSKPGGPPAPPAMPAPSCPVCNSATYDNRRDKKSPAAPDFKCKNKSCLDASGKITAGWVDPKADGGVRWAKPAPAAPAYDGGGGYAGSFGENEIDLDDDDLPF